MAEDLETQEDTGLDKLEKVIQEFAPEVADIYEMREDESEEQQIKTGRLHENRILGIILKYYLNAVHKVTTSEVELDYRIFFKDIARSTISTYLNMLKKESILFKERDGRIVYYIFYEDPPTNIKPFWFIRMFCIVPPYFVRAINFSELYLNSEELIQGLLDAEDYEMVLKNFKFLVGLIILFILKNRVSKCLLCQFSKREIYTKMEEEMDMAIKDRSDVLPEELLEALTKYGEIPIFEGIKIHGEEAMNRILREILKFADDYKKDLEFQIMVSSRRTDLRLRQKISREKKENIEDKDPE